MDSTMSPGAALGAKARARVALVMMTAALAACGGGGGGSPTPPPSPPPPPPPAPTPLTLSLKADAASVQAGDQAVGLHAMLGSSPTSVNWTLTGPGTLSATTGTDVQYTPPDADGLDDAQTATVTITTFNFPQQSVDIAVAAIDRPGHHWTLQRASANAYSDVAVGKDGFVASSSSGVSTSPDGLTWTDIPLYPSPAAVAWGAAGWVGVTNQGVAWFSADAVTWTKSPDAIPSGLNRVVYGNHTYFAYGAYNNSAVSTDGTHWTPVSTKTGEVAFGNGEFMALRQEVGSGGSVVVQPATSTDGINWQPATLVPNLYTIAFANGQFDANSGTWVQVTSDGSTWIGSDAAPDYHGSLLRAAGNTLFELAYPDMGVQLPGAGWQRASTGDFVSNPAAVAANADRYVGVSQNGWIESSTDALHWSTQVQGSYGDLRVVDVVDGQFVALSDLNHVLRSVDGVTWTSAAILAGAGAYGPYATAIAHAGRTAVATATYGYVGTSSRWMRSLDAGATWSLAGTTGPAESMAGIVYDGRRFVSISASGGVYASPDGDAWGQIGAAPVPLAGYHGMAYGGGTYLAFADGMVATSTDGVTWTAVDASAFGIPLSHVRSDGALWTGTQFVFMGGDSQSYYANTIAAVSTDGRAWTTKTTSVYNQPMSLAKCGSEIVAIGNGVIASSTDGLNWYSHATVNGASQLNSVACSADRFVGVGWASAIVTSTR